MKTVMTISRADPPTVLLENGSMAHNQTETVIPISHADPPTVLVPWFIIKQTTETISDLSRECMVSTNDA